MRTLELFNSNVVLVIKKISAFSDVIKHEEFGTYYVEIVCDGQKYQEHFPDSGQAHDFRADLWDIIMDED